MTKQSFTRLLVNSFTYLRMKVSKKLFTIVLLTLGINLPAQNAVNIRLTRVGESNSNTNVVLLPGQEQLSGQAFQQDMLLTYKGYQYTVYYNDTRNVCIARRKLPLGEWREVVLPYPNSADDSHNVISLGICKNDGTIHLAYDHHNSPLHYSHSVLDLANNPETMKWNAGQFGETTDILETGIRVPDVTYPRFISKPDGNLLLECRYRLSGDGDSYLREYSGETHQWTLVGRYVQGMDANPNACAYINRMDYDNRGRLHVSWCWRDDFGGGSNHDIFYGYSEDHGRTWKNNAGEQVAVTETIHPTDSRASGACMRQGISSLQIAAIAYNRGYINQESQSSDTQGRVHILNSYMPDGDGTDANWESSRTKARLHHRFRKADGTWAVNQVKNNGTAVHSYCRSQVVADAFDNALVIANGAEIYASTSVANYADWELLSDVDKNRFCSEPQIDHPRLLQDGVLSFVYLGRDKKVTVIDYLMDNPHQPDGAGLAVRTEGDFTVWSGSLETLFGEQYTLHLHTDAETSVYVDGLLLIEKNAGGQQDLSAVIPLIASHKHNMEVRTKSTAPFAALLSWQSAHTPKAAIPETSLYPVEEITDDSDNLYPYPPELPELQDFGGVNINIENFMPSFNDFTLEVAATGETIVIGNGYITYTPTAAGTVRFAQKDGKVYVFEGKTYKGELTPAVPMSFPDIFDETDNAAGKTGIYDERNLFKNPGFETVAEYIPGYDPQTKPADIRSKAADWNTLASYYGSSRANNLSVNPGYAAMLPSVEGDYAFMLHGYGAGDEGMSLWQQLTGIQPNTAYKVTFRHLSHGDTSPANSTYKVSLGGLFSGYFAGYSYGSPAQGFGNYTDVSFTFLTPSNLPVPVYFFISRTATCIAHFDRMTLIEGTANTGAGITGVTSATCLEGTAYAPGTTITGIAAEKPAEQVKISGGKNVVRIRNFSAQPAGVSIYDMCGRRVWLQKNVRADSAVTLPCGIYAVIVDTPGRIYREKIMVK
jgi:hypothetical protein